MLYPIVRPITIGTAHPAVKRRIALVSIKRP
jgi:hypothetical protein